MTQFFKKLNNERGAGLVWVYLSTAVLGISAAGLFGMSLWQSRMMSIEESREKAFYFAEAAVDQKLNELRQNNMNNVNSTTIDNGTYSVLYDNATKIMTATGTCSGASRTLSVKVKQNSSSGLHGAISGNGNMSTNGDIKIDGRDHDLNGNVIGSGLYGVSTSGTFSQGGSSKVGGNGAAPADPAPAGSIEQNGAAMASTPEAILGLPAGSLDQYKTTTVPHLPMNGIIYITSNGSGSHGNLWDGPDFGECDDNGNDDYDDHDHGDDDRDDDGHHDHHEHKEDDAPSQGILIFHNAAGNAELKNVHGCFKGIIITDQLTHISGDALLRGAVAVMSASSNVGNGAATVQYSTAAINNSFSSLSNYTIVSWEDTLN